MVESNFPKISKIDSKSLDSKMDSKKHYFMKFRQNFRIQSNLALNFEKNAIYYPLSLESFFFFCRIYALRFY